MLSIKQNFLFIHVPKTGGNTIQSALLPFSEDRMALVAPHHDGVNRFEIRSPNLDTHKHSGLNEYKQTLEPEVFNRLTKVTCVRNPWDRCVSFFFSPHRGKVDWSADAFEAFIESKVQPHKNYLEIDGGERDPFDNVDIVLRFERLADDFSRLCERLAIDEPPLPHLNASSRGDFRSYYTRERTVELVRDKFALEIARFNYSF